MKIINIKIEDLKPYEKNPRKNEKAIDFVANSIKEFGFKVPLVVDKNNVIVAGHTRYQASKKLGLKEVPCLVADDLTDEQIKAFRIADNKTNDMAEWDDALLGDELKDLIDSFDMTDFGFGEFEISMLTEDMEPEEYDKDLIKEYSSSSEDFLTNKRVIITYKTEEEEQFLKELFKEEDELRVVYPCEDIMENING